MTLGRQAGRGALWQQMSVVDAREVSHFTGVASGVAFTIYAGFLLENTPMQHWGVALKRIVINRHLLSAFNSAQLFQDIMIPGIIRRDDVEQMASPTPGRFRSQVQFDRSILLHDCRSNNIGVGIVLALLCT
jgi:hypothetical protein